MVTLIELKSSYNAFTSNSEHYFKCVRENKRSVGKQWQCDNDYMNLLPVVPASDWSRKKA